MKCVKITAIEPEEETQPEKPQIKMPDWLPIAAVAGALAVAYYIKER